LIGVVEEDGRIANLGTPLPVDPAFWELSPRMGRPSDGSVFPRAASKDIAANGMAAGAV
jgi:hypothetical protein